VLRDALAEVVGGGWRIEVAFDGTPAATGPSAATRPAEPVAPEAPPVDEADEVDEETDEVSRSAAGADAESVALALLQSGLGARPIDGP
jgi:hypothetical protein